MSRVVRWGVTVSFDNDGYHQWVDSAQFTSREDRERWVEHTNSDYGPAVVSVRRFRVLKRGG